MMTIGRPCEGLGPDFSMRLTEKDNIKFRKEAHRRKIPLGRLLRKKLQERSEMIRLLKKEVPGGKKWLQSLEITN